MKLGPYGLGGWANGVGGGPEIGCLWNWGEGRWGGDLRLGGLGRTGGLDVWVGGGLWGREGGGGGPEIGCWGLLGG